MVYTTRVIRNGQELLMKNMLSKHTILPKNTSLKNVYVIMTLMITIILGNATLWAKAPSKKLIGREIPDYIKIETLDGTPVDVLTDKGRYILAYWASWCLPCIKELQVLDKIQEELNNVNIQLVLVNADRKSDRVVPKFFKKWNIENLKSYKANMYDGFKAFDATGLPIVVSVENGKIVDLLDLNTHKWDEKGSLQYFKQVFGENK